MFTLSAAARREIEDGRACARRRWPTLARQGFPATHWPARSLDELLSMLEQFESGGIRAPFAMLGWGSMRLRGRHARRFSPEIAPLPAPRAGWIRRARCCSKARA